MWSKRMPWAEFDPCGNMVTSTRLDLSQEQVDRLFQEGHLDDVTKDDNYVRPFAEEPMELRLTHIDENGKIFWWEDTKTRNRYPMRGTEFNKLLAQGIKQTLVRGVWSAQKRGYALGITLVSCDERRFEEAQQMRQP